MLGIHLQAMKHAPQYKPQDRYVATTDSENPVGVKNGLDAVSIPHPPPSPLIGILGDIPARPLPTAASPATLLLAPIPIIRGEVAVPLLVLRSAGTHRLHGRCTEARVHTAAGGHVAQGHSSGGQGELRLLHRDRQEVLVTHAGLACRGRGVRVRWGGSGGGGR